MSFDFVEVNFRLTSFLKNTKNYLKLTTKRYLNLQYIKCVIKATKILLKKKVVKKVILYINGK